MPHQVLPDSLLHVLKGDKNRDGAGGASVSGVRGDVGLYPSVSAAPAPNRPRRQCVDWANRNSRRTRLRHAYFRVILVTRG